jgi:hypothetical protein
MDAHKIAVAHAGSDPLRRSFSTTNASMALFKEDEKVSLVSTAMLSARDR